MNPFERNFFICLNEAIAEAKEGRGSVLEGCPTTTRIDRTGKAVKLQCGDKFDQGKNGRGVAIKPGHSAQEDATGQKISVPPCQRLKAGSNKKAIPVCPGESTEEVNGQIRKRSDSKRKLSNRLTFEEMVDRLGILFDIG